MFALHQRLQADTLFVARLDLCQVLLMNDASFPWLILVPERADIREIHELTADDRSLLIEEIVRASRVLEALYRPNKINVGALGNRVPQLHVHVIARYRDDRAWPGPVWGVGPPQFYPDAELRAAVHRLARVFSEGVSTIP